MRGHTMSDMVRKLNPQVQTQKNLANHKACWENSQTAQREKLLKNEYSDTESNSRPPSSLDWK